MKASATNAQTLRALNELQDRIAFNSDRLAELSGQVAHLAELIAAQAAVVPVVPAKMGTQAAKK